MHHPVNILLWSVSSVFNGLAAQLSCIGDMTSEVAHISAICVVLALQRVHETHEKLLSITTFLEGDFMGFKIRTCSTKLG